MLPLMSPDWRSLGEARLALASLAPNAEFLIASVPAQLRSDAGLIYDELRWRTRKDMVDAAVQILLSQPGDPVRPASWWPERQAIARRVLSTGNAELAYRIAEQHGPIEGIAYSEAEFLLGYIALRYLKNPADAVEHFARIPTPVSTPYAKARAGYWGGRAAAAQAEPELAATIVCRGGRAQGHLLRAAGRPPTRRRRPSSPGARAGSRCRRARPLQPERIGPRCPHLSRSRLPGPEPRSFC